MSWNGQIEEEYDRTKLIPLCAANSFRGAWSQVTGKALQKCNEFHLKLSQTYKQQQ